MKMRDSISKKQECKLFPNQRIIGRWHRHPYRIVRELGYGATGTVYLAESESGPVALKIARDSMSITSEVNVMRHFSKVQGPSLGPCFYDVDDYLTKDAVFPFYVMEYIQGESFLPFIRDRGAEWMGVLVVQLLNELYRLHQIGWVFGDLKPENLLVADSPYRVRWLDVGGMTRHGRSIKEYTEFFDRGYWGLGSRKAEPGYDLFSVSMLMINCAYPARFEKNGTPGIGHLMGKVRQKQLLAPYEAVILNGFQGKYQSALAMRMEMLNIIQDNSFNRKNKMNRAGSAKVATNRRAYRKNVTTAKEKHRWTGVYETMLIGTFLLILYILYLFGQ